MSQGEKLFPSGSIASYVDQVSLELEQDEIAHKAYQKSHEEDGENYNYYNYEKKEDIDNLQTFNDMHLQLGDVGP